MDLTYCDAHLHLVQCTELASKPISEAFPPKYRCCTCSHDEKEFNFQFELTKDYPQNVVQSFGLHPQNPDLSLLPFLESLLSEDKISAIGETGMDLFTQEYRENRQNQIEAWHSCLELAVEYKKTVVIHNRKALDQMFSDIKLLKRAKCIVFHSFAFGPREAHSLLDKGLNAYFSFGKPIINGNKKSIACIRELPAERILLETDAPFQTLKGEEFTSVSDIKKVYEEASALRGTAMPALCVQIEKNFMDAYCVKESR
ncbi:MAG: TatD family hydrolase [Treponema sp.]|nr:TatD family hydrolase [Treponema sp.]